MAACEDCRGTGLRGGDGTTPDHVGRLVTCVKCTGTGQKLEEKSEAAAPVEETIHTEGEAPVKKPSILERLLG